MRQENDAMLDPRPAPCHARRAYPGPGARPWLLALATVALVAACGSSGSVPTSPAATVTPQASATSGRPTTFPNDLPVVATVPPTSPPVVGEAPANLVAATRADLAGRIGSEAAGAAVVVRSEAVTWPNGSLGCPQPGMYYQPIEVEGYHVVFDVDGTQYDYRATVGGNLLACEQGGPRP